MAYDQARGQMVLFGGATSAYTTCETANSQTWAWNSSLGAWSQLSPLHSPPALADHGMVYDSRRQKIVLFGGCSDAGISGDTWEWDGLDWAKAPVSGPLPRATFGMAFDSSRGASWIFSGCSAAPEPCPATDYLDDTWQYGP
jgi:hypothetical protein